MNGIMSTTEWARAALTAGPVVAAWIGGNDVAEGTCSDSACERAAWVRGMCERHYKRWWLDTPRAERWALRPTFEQRFWSKVDVRGLFDCWEWQAHIDGKGYGKFQVSDRECKLAHRIAYRLVKGPIPDGLELDHLCRNPRCVNPGHLEAVTHLVNMERSAPATKTHCVNGHEYNAENTHWWGRRRFCRACNRVHRRNYKARLRNAA